MVYTTQFFILFPFFLIHSCLSLYIPSSTQCGCSQVRPLLTQSKIVGGYTARSHSWPWIVSLRHLSTDTSSTSPGFAFCAGTLISDKYVLTAAHCFYSVSLGELSNYFVVVGAQYINDTNPVQFTIKSVIIHDKYNDDTNENDIALLELTYRVDLNDSNIGFICLPPNNILYPNQSMNATAIGWGLLEANGSLSYTLQQVQLPIIPYSNAYCSYLAYNDSIQICAGFTQGGKDTCQGDSGGPLMIYDSNSDTWNIAGITSFGHGCALPRYPGVYTRVSAFVNWITAHINDDVDDVNSKSHASMESISNGIILFLFCVNLFF